MALRILGKLKPPFAVAVFVLGAAIVLALQLMSSATQDASRLGRIYTTLVAVGLASSVVLLGLVVANVVSLVRQLRRRVAGARLIARMAFVFVLLTLAPAGLVFHYSLKFLHRNIDSWFNVRIDNAMDAALKLGQAALDERMRSVLKQTERLAEELKNATEGTVAWRLAERVENTEATDIVVFSKQGGVLATSGDNPTEVVPSWPSDIVAQVRQDQSYVGLETPTRPESTQIRTVVMVNTVDDPMYLQAFYSMPIHTSRLLETVEAEYLGYQEMVYLRRSLKLTFSTTLALVLLLSMSAAVWVAFLSIRRIVAPVRYLVHGTQAVAEGHYENRLPVKSRDDLGVLVESFNAMTARIAETTAEAHSARLEAEHQRAYLETVLANLSSGVLSLDPQGVLRTANLAADHILHAPLHQRINLRLEAVGAEFPVLEPLLDLLLRHAARRDAWREELVLMGPQGRQDLLVRQSPLLGETDEWLGAVIVFDDVTALLQAQRNAAWGEVARRLAHEIKNPLTPIQLSAERLQIKLSKHLQESEADTLARATRTIIQQVEALKTMVNAFSEYAKPVRHQPVHCDIRRLVDEVVALYPPSARITFEVTSPDCLPAAWIDPVRIRQVLHNLIKNAQEAIEPTSAAHVEIALSEVQGGTQSHLELSIRDQGPGVAAEQADSVFEPYVTSKAKGTGLGLAIVKRIVEEHGGNIWLDTACQDGARFVIRLPSAGEIQPLETHPA